MAWIPGRSRLATADEAIGRINDPKVWHAVNMMFSYEPEVAATTEGRAFRG
ncbi:hypothetical protein [Ensifer adhaerens]|uniref:hypothetical protein n=1 Tax=Ensifer adhaerens TaxID=106592 RepID=UPI0014480694|nr:hypothetical protein [Ensifer adhaerens]MDF8354799.1 hypothetical protein [Ensifer adhaerens]